ncbi:5-(carboxyamino)imidazole ribonucleotide synthase [Nakamurella sp. UYEF19]|uniref:5-(carboxyamino)imidazole ribonucleotide synthase n=1 Tax=Nakamurella sp. UYEF19 TaxID=1756392 RepID=UPI003394929C
MDSRTGMPRVGMVGGGQLARMTHQSAIALGQSLRVLSIGADESAALVAPDVEIGSHLDLDALTKFAENCDVVTFDHEHVPTEHIRALVAAGHAVFPGADALQYAQDKSLMRTRLRDAGLPVPTFAVLEPGADLVAEVASFGATHGWPVVLKTARGGYDGRGVWVLDDADAAAPLQAELSGELVLESFVRMKRELAAVVARSPFGQAAAWPVVETVQQDGICVEVIAPAPGLDPDVAAAASRMALRIAGELGVVGVLAVELFEVDADDAVPDGLLINELAMRPHNSGHWSMDGSVTSQFEQHLRAVLDYPLGRTDAVAPFTVMGNVLGGPDTGPGSEIGMDERVHHLAARFPQVKIHLYGKAFRPGRKLGHVNVLGSDLGELRRIAALAAAWLGDGLWTDGYEIHTGATSARSVPDARPARSPESSAPQQSTPERTGALS